MDPARRTSRRRQALLAPLALAAVFALSALATIPPAGAKAGEFHHAEIDLHPEVFSARLIGETREGGNASNFRRIVDEDHGNGDGKVTQDEVETYETAVRQDFNDQIATARRFGVNPAERFLVNGRAPLEVIVTDVRVSPEVLGPTTDTTTLTRDIDAEMRYPATGRDRANLSFEDDFRHAFPTLSWGYAVFSGAAPWAIDPDTIEPADVRERFWTGDGFNITFDESPEFASGFEPLSFQLHNASAAQKGPDGKKKDSPGLALPFTLAALGLLAVAARRRT